MSTMRPLPLAQLVVGVVAHRDLAPESRPQVEAAEREFLLDLRAAYPALPVAVMSALAEGGDRWVAHCALELDMALIAPLPLPPAQYEADFAGAASRTEFAALIPGLYVVIVLAALFQPTFWMLLAILALFQWISITFFMRTEMYREKTREYCLAARSYGASHLRIVFRHLLPNCLTPLVTFTPFAVVGAIFALTGLDFLGYGLPAPTPSWGELIDQALQVENRRKLWLILSPFTALTVTLVLVVFIGESVREAFDPKRHARYE